MNKQVFDVHVERVNESANKEAEFNTKAVAISISEDGQLTISGEGDKVHTLGATTWGSITVTRVPRK